MSITKEHRICNCGNTEMESNFNENTGEVQEFCDCCGFYNMIHIINRPTDRKEFYSGWKPEYKQDTSTTNAVLKIFNRGINGYSVACIDKEGTKQIILSLKKDTNVEKFAITFKNKSNNYQTQIFKN